MQTRRTVIIVACILLLLCTCAYVMRETYLDENGAALVCYWAPQAPTMAVPIPRDPFGATARDGPSSSSFDVIQKNPMIIPPPRIKRPMPVQPTFAPLNALPVQPTVSPLNALPVQPTVSPLNALPVQPTFAPLNTMLVQPTVSPLMIS